MESEGKRVIRIKVQADAEREERDENGHSRDRQQTFTQLSGK